MFPPPEIIQAEVFARLPDHHRREGIVTPWAAARRGGAPIPCFLEGPSFDRSGALYVTDIPFGRVFRVSQAGEFTAGSDLVTNIAFGGPDMRTLYFTDSGDGTVQRARLPVAGRRMFSHSDTEGLPA